MRLGMMIAALCWLTCAAPANLPAADGPATQESQPTETNLSPLNGFKSQLPNPQQLQSLLGSLLRHIEEQHGGGPYAAPQDDVAPPQPQTDSLVTSDGNLLPPAPDPDGERALQAPGNGPALESPAAPDAPQWVLPPPPFAVAPPFPPPHHHHPRLSHSEFSQWLLARRMALLERIRADALAHGDTDMAAHTEQLEGFVVELHQVGLIGMAQRLGQMGVFSGGNGESEAAPSGSAEFPETDFGQASWPRQPSWALRRSLVHPANWKLPKSPTLNCCRNCHSPQLPSDTTRSVSEGFSRNRCGQLLVPILGLRWP